MPEVALSHLGVVQASTDAVIVTTFEEATSPAYEEADRILDGLLTEMRESRELLGKFPARTSLRTLGRMASKRLMVLGLGRPGELDSYRLHNAYHLAGAALRRQGVTSVTAFVDPSLTAALGDGDGPVAVADVARAAVTGLLLGNFTGRANKTEEEDEEPSTSIERVEIGGLDDDGSLTGALSEAAVLAEATNLARTWATTPSNQLTPTLLAQTATELFEGTGLEVEVLRKADLERLKMGALLGVAQGSDEPPVMICVRWDGGRPDGPRLALVGKGITFDTGGISIKPAGGMELMKYDMGGGAAVLAAMWAIARLGAQANVIGVVPATENMPGGRAYKPGDVLRSHLGKTIEVTNTDAEGRIVLADGLAQARDMGATHIVDAATLTGAVVVALGHAATGMMGNDRALADLVRRASALGGDRVAELPMHPEYEVCLESDVADMKNAGERPGGPINGGIFLREFVGDTPWVHLDIAGTGWNDQGSLTSVPKGPSGTPVRTFVHLAFEFGKL